MKIGLDTVPITSSETYAKHLARVLAQHAPEHEYILDHRARVMGDIYHAFTIKLPLSIGRTRGRSVVTVADLNFLRHPQMFTLFERVVRHQLYRLACRRADCLITLNRRAKDELSERLSIQECKIKVLLPLGVRPPSTEHNQMQREAVRRKYDLPADFILMVGVAEPRQHQIEVIHAAIEVGIDNNLVICSRRTAYSDFLLSYVRAVGEAPRVEFIYEPDQLDMPDIFRLSRAFVALPDNESEVSILSLVEAMRGGVPMVLSDLPLHREVAGDAAFYLPKGAEDRLATALECVVRNEDSRCELIELGYKRAELFSELAVAQRLIEIYTSL